MKFKLAPAVKQQWIDALLSGKYKQGKGALFKKDASRHKSYCCLGVLGCVMGIPEEELLGEGFLVTNIEPWMTGSEFKILPEKVQIGLSSLNDAHVPFEVIAGFINENL